MIHYLSVAGHTGGVGSRWVGEYSGLDAVMNDI